MEPQMIELFTSFARNFIKIQLEEEKKCEIERVKYEKRKIIVCKTNIGKTAY